MVRTASVFAKRMVEAERERLRDKERAARRLAEAVDGLRAAAQRLREATDEYVALEPVSRTRLSGLLDLTGTESRIAYDAKHALVRLPDMDGQETVMEAAQVEELRPAVPDVASPTPSMGGGDANAAPMPTPW